MHVVPGASRSEVKGRHGDAVKIRVAAGAEGGRANRALLDLIEATTGGSAEVISGATSRTKTVLVRGVAVARVRRVLER